MDPEAMRLYAALCGWTLARAHARTGDRIAIAGYLDGGAAFDRALVEFAERYADLNDGDYACLKAAAKAGRLPAQSGVSVDAAGNPAPAAVAVRDLSSFDE
jgi:hypothetical protein